MNRILQDIENAKHIEIEVEKDFLCVGSALYTYILTQHKKVSFVCKSKELDLKFSFLPWFEKIKSTHSSSADLKLELKLSCLELYAIFQNADIRVNNKMATALYGALLFESDNFTSSLTDGTYFAIASQLISSGAEYKLATESLVKRTRLSEFRLKSIMFKNMLLLNEAKAAVFTISENDFKASGARIEDSIHIMREALYLEYVELSILLNTDAENEIIKIMNKEI